MANNELQIKPQRLISSTNHQNNKNPRKLYNHFLFKPLILTFFLVLIQFFPSEPPDFVSQSIFTRSWEVIYLIFVGIIVSYGLFSRKNDDPNDENNSKFDHAQSYMSRLFHVSDEIDDDNDDVNGKKIQTWNSKYVRNEPMIVVAEKSCVLDENNCGNNGEKPLLLPVRSLKSRVCDQNDGDFVDFGVSRVYNRSNTSPIDKDFSKNSKSLSRNDLSDENDGDFVDFGCSRVYTRPIDMGFSKKSKSLSRNDLIGLVHDDDSRISSRGHGRSNSSTNSKEFSGESYEFRGCDENDGNFVDYGGSRVYTRSNTRPIEKGFPKNSKTLSRNDLIGLVNDDDSRATSRGHGRSNSSSGSREFSSGSNEFSRIGSVKSRDGGCDDNVFVDGDSEVSRSLYRSNSSLKSRSFSSHSSRHSNGDNGELNGGVEKRDEKVGEGLVLPSPIPWRSRSGKMEMKGESKDSTTTNLVPPSLENSEAFRLLRPRSSPSKTSSSPPPKEVPSSPNASSPTKVSSSLELEAKSVQDFGRRKSNYSSRLPPPPPPPPPPRFQTTNRSQLVRSPSRKNEKISSSQNDMRSTVQGESKDFSWHRRDESSKNTKEGFEGRNRNAESYETESPKKNSLGYNQMTRESFSEHPKETRDFLEHVLSETDDESESEAENYKEERTETQKANEGHSETSHDEGPDVDKKADEFIAKFREQIRLQRIESIKKSTGQLRSSAR